MDSIRENLKQANELITTSIQELEENNPTEIETIDTLKENRIEIGGLIQKMDIKTTL